MGEGPRARRRHRDAPGASGGGIGEDGARQARESEDFGKGVHVRIRTWNNRQSEVDDLTQWKCAAGESASSGSSAWTISRLGIGEERRAAVVAVLRLEGARELLHFRHAALRQLREQVLDGAGARALVLAPVERPDDAVRHVAVAVHGEAHAVLVHALLAEARDDRAQLRRIHLQGVLQERHARADGVGAHAPVGLAAVHVVGVRQQALEDAAGQHLGDGRARLRDPLLEARGAPGVAARVLLPAEERLAARRGHRGDHEARIGEQLRRLRHAREVDARDLPGDGRVAEARRQAAQLREVARQLVDRVEVRHQRQRASAAASTCACSCTVQRLRVVAGDGAGGDRVLGPRDHGRGDEERLPGEVALHDGHRLRDALDALDEHVVGAGVGLPEVVERPVQRRVVAVLEELLHQGGDLAFPEAVLGEAAGGVQSVGQGDESFGVPGEAGRGLASGAGHGGGAGRGKRRLG